MPLRVLMVGVATHREAGVGSTLRKGELQLSIGRAAHAAGAVAKRQLLMLMWPIKTL